MAILKSLFTPMILKTSNMVNVFRVNLLALSKNSKRKPFTETTRKLLFRNPHLKYCLEESPEAKKSYCSVIMLTLQNQEKKSKSQASTKTGTSCH